MLTSVRSLTLLLGCMVAATAAMAADSSPAIGDSTSRPVTVEIAILEFPVEDSPAAGDGAEASERVLARIRELQKSGKAQTVTRLRLTTLEGHPATVQFGENVAVPNGRVLGGGRGEGITSYVRDSFGTLAEVVAEVQSDDSIQLSLNVERSRFRADTTEPAAEAVASRDNPPAKETLIVKTTLRITDGETVVAHVHQNASGDGSSLLVVLVGAQVQTAKTPAR